MMDDRAIHGGDEDTAADTERALRRTIESQRVEIEELSNPWISVHDRLPPDCSSYATRSMHLICNDGFVTIGFWYPKAAEWHDAGRNGGYNITSQVTHWMPMPKGPETTKDCEHRNRAEFLDGEYCLTCEQKLPEKDSQ